jgi:phenylpyruvate tautomerase PptA (4-oxalocrotonate tautomerase family)
MATRKTTPSLIQGHATHTRTQDSYMGVLLDAVTLDDWREVVTGAVQAAKGGDPQARTWLAQYLVGRPESKAPTAVSVIVNQLTNNDLIVNKLADKLTAPTFDFGSTGNRAQITQQIKAELVEKIKHVETIENPASMRVSGDS